MVRICTSHSLTVSASTALLGGTRTVICSVYLFRHICISPQRVGRPSNISNSMSICVLMSGRRLPFPPSAVVLLSKSHSVRAIRLNRFNLGQQGLFYVPSVPHRGEVRGFLSFATSTWYASLRGAPRSASYCPLVYPASARSVHLPTGADGRADREEVGPCPRHPQLSPQEASNQVLITLQSCEYRTPLHIDVRSCTLGLRSTLSRNTLHPP